MKNLKRVVKLHVMGTVCPSPSVTYFMSSCEKHVMMIIIISSIALFFT